MERIILCEIKKEARSSLAWIMAVSKEMFSIFKWITNLPGALCSYLARPVLHPFPWWFTLQTSTCRIDCGQLQILLVILGTVSHVLFGE